MLLFTEIFFRIRYMIVYMLNNNYVYFAFEMPLDYIEYGL
jgi:hypothetical protein